MTDENPVEGGGPRDPALDIDIWGLLERSVGPRPQPKEATKDAESSTETKPPIWKTMRWKLWFLAADVMGLVCWTYVALKLFVFDIDRELVNEIWPSATWIVGYRVFLIPVLAVVVGIFFWRLLALAFAIYVALFPLIVLLWKVPWFVAKRRSWTLVMVSANVVANFVRNLRYVAVSKGVWVLSAIAIILFDGDVIVGIAGVSILLLLLWSVCRVTVNSFQPNWFLAVQQMAIEKAMNSAPLKASVTVTAKDIPENQAVLTQEQVQAVATKIQSAAVLNRALYFWAFRLRDYKRTQTAMALNLTSYLWLFVGSAVTFGLANLALVKVDASQYSFVDYPTQLEVIAYGMSTMFWGSVGGLSAEGDAAYLIMIVAGLFGPLFLAVFVLNLLFILQREREDAELTQTVEFLKQQAQKHEEEFRTALKVSVAEAVIRMNQLGLFGFLAFADWLARDIPADFMTTEPTGTK